MKIFLMVVLIGQMFLAWFIRRFIFLSSIRKRIDFEQGNIKDTYSKSFHATGEQADLAVEVSSEGEWEQIKLLVLEKLDQGKRVEIIYFSPSLQPTMQKLSEKYLQQVRILRLPLLTYSYFSPWSLHNWLTAKELVLVRYDLLPELLAQRFFGIKKLRLVWATLKNKKGPRFLFHLLCLKFFHEIVPATLKDELFLKKWFSARVIQSFEDARIMAIKDRLYKRQDKLNHLFPFYREWQTLIASFPHRLIIGSAYTDELELLENEMIKEMLVAKQLVIVMVPHQLNQNWQQWMAKSQIDYAEINAPLTAAEWSQHQVNPKSVWIINLKGVLCELYQDFNWAFVGGGFHRSVHSVLEPYLSGSFVLTGPKVHRSTEVDLIDEWDNQRYYIADTQMELIQFLLARIRPS